MSEPFPPTDDGWPERRAGLLAAVVPLLYGGLPPAGGATGVELLHAWFDRRQRINTYRVSAGPDPGLAFTMQVRSPLGPGPFPVILDGDACWPDLGDGIIDMVLERNCALALFNRTEVAPDIYRPTPQRGLHRLFPGATFGTLAAWAWGYQRCVDALLALDTVDDPYLDKHRIPLDREAIAVVGHSRGGKAALLAGATDGRIALTSANCSGFGGAGSLLRPGAGAETLDDALAAVPHWYGPGLAAFAGRQGELPFDQDVLKALVAPRCLLTTEALDDPASDPIGAWYTHVAAREVFARLGVPERIGIRFRPGGHHHGPEDWMALLDFIAWQLRGLPSAAGFNLPPGVSR